jgi:hypothetical protein
MQVFRPHMLLLGLTACATLAGCSSATVSKQLHENTSVLGDTVLRRIARDGDGLPERIEILRGDDIAWIVEGLSLAVLEAYEGKGGRPVPIKPGDDVTGNGQGDIVITQSLEGAHCGQVVWILSMDEWFGIYVAHRVRVPAPAEIVDIDGDGTIEIVTADDAFAYFGGLSLADSPRPTAVLKLDGGDYVWWPEGTVAWLRKAASEEPDSGAALQFDKYHQVDGVGATLLSRVAQMLYEGHDSDAWTLLDHVAADSSVASGLRESIVRCMLHSWIGRDVLARSAASTRNYYPGQ